MNYEKIKNYAALCVLILAVGALIYLGASKLFALSLPFLIAWGTAFAVRPVSHKVAERTGIPLKAVSLFFTLLSVISVIGVLFLLIFLAAREAWGFLSELAADEGIYRVISDIMDRISEVFGDDGDFPEIEARIAEAIKEFLTSFLGKFVVAVSGIVSYIPGIVIFIFTGIVASVYFALELDGVNLAVRSFLPERLFRALVKFKNSFLSAMVLYLRSYLVIMAVVFAILLVGFLFMRVKYALILALVFAVLDMLPLIGVGSFMIPWAIFELIFGRVYIGIGLIVLFATAEIVRNLIEPRIVGKNLGLHPILTLLVLYAAYSLFGFFGLFLTPLFTVALNALINKDNSTEVDEGGGTK